MAAVAAPAGRRWRWRAPRPRPVLLASIFCVTAAALYVLDGSIWSATKTTGVVAKHALGDRRRSPSGHVRSRSTMRRSGSPSSPRRHRRPSPSERARPSAALAPTAELDLHGGLVPRSLVVLARLGTLSLWRAPRPRSSGEACSGRSWFRHRFATSRSRGSVRSEPPASCVRVVGTRVTPVDMPVGMQVNAAAPAGVEADDDPNERQDYDAEEDPGSPGHGDGQRGSFRFAGTVVPPPIRSGEILSRTVQA